jgi:hypothetical protein
VKPGLCVTRIPRVVRWIYRFEDKYGFISSSLCERSLAAGLYGRIERSDFWNRDGYCQCPMKMKEALGGGKESISSRLVKMRKSCTCHLLPRQSDVMTAHSL